MKVRGADLLCVAVVALVLGEAALKFASYQDDAFIYFRYAASVVHREGLVYNPGERVEGFTSPLWLLLLVATGSLGISPLLAAGVLGTLATAATVLLSVRDGRLCGPPSAFGALAPWALATFVPLLLWAVSGLETALFTCLLWAALSSYRIATHRRRAPGLALGALLAGALLARPEGALATLVLGAAVLLRKDRSLRSAAGVLLPPLACAALVVVARLAYFHQLLPNTFYAKLGGTPRHYVVGLAYVGHFLRATPLVWLIPLLAVRGGHREVPALGASLAFVALWILEVARTGGDYFQYFRFMIPVAPLLFALGAHGAHHAVGLVTRALERRSPLPRWTCHAVAAALLAGITAFQLEPVAWRVQHGLEWATRWARLGRTLARAVPPDSTVALPNIGAVGYYSNLPVVDLLGLVDGELSHRPTTLRADERLSSADVGHERFDVAWSMDRRPAVLVFMHAYSAEPFTDPSEIPADLWVERRLLAYLATHPGYRLVNLPVEPHQYWGLFIRDDLPLPGPR